MNVLVIILILLKNEIAPSFERAIAQGARLPSHLPEFGQTCSFVPAGFGTIRFRGGCRGFTGPVPPPLWIRVPLGAI
jgi:hypothetical protein